MKIKYQILIIMLIFTLKVHSFNYIDSIVHDDHLLRYDSIISTYSMDKICGSNLDDCSKKNPNSSLSIRLKNFIAWLVIRNKNQSKVFKQLDKRVLSLYPNKICTFSEPLIKPAGDPKSPIKLIAYVKASCSLCKRVVIPMHLAVQSEILKGIATLEIRPMTVTLGDKALLAAAKQNKGWDFFLALEKEDRRFNEKIIIEIATKIELNIEQFKNDLYSPEIHNILVKLREEAMKNDFNTAPTLYINNYRYQSYKDPQWLIDAIEYNYEMKKGSK